MLRGATAQDGVSPPAVGLLQTIVGSVIVTRANQAIADSIGGDLLCLGDRIETGADGLTVILFPDGTTFQLGANAEIVLGEFTGGFERAARAALIRIAKGAFRLITGQVSSSVTVDTPFAQFRNVAPAASFGSLVFGVLTFGLISELKAASSNLALLDDETITYKDVKHGVFVIVTKESNPRVIVVDDPGESIVVRSNGSNASVEHVANSLSQMAQIENAYEGVATVYSLGKQDPFIQHFQQGANPNDHANAQPQSAPSSTGSSTSPTQLNITPQLIQESSGVQLASNVQSSAPAVTPTVIEAAIITTNSQTSSPPVFAALPTTVNWISASSGNWEVGLNWNINLSPPAQDTVEINLPVTVTIDRSEAVATLVIGEGTILNIVSGGSLLVSNEINNAGVIILNDPTLSVSGKVTLTGGGVIENLGPTTADLIVGVANTNAALENINNTITGSGLIGQGDGNLTLQNDAAGTINANISGQPIIIDTGNTVINLGLMEATKGGTLTVRDSVANSGILAATGGILHVVGAVSGSGSATISGGGTLELGGADAQLVMFSDASTLKLDNPASFSGQIDGLAVGDIIDLKGTTVTSAFIDSSTLTVTESNGTQLFYKVAGALSGDYFAIQSDGASGDELVLSPTAAAPTITVTTAAHTTSADAAVHPFAGVTIADPNSGATDTLTITLSGAGATGTLSGSISAAAATASTPWRRRRPPP